MFVARLSATRQQGLRIARVPFITLRLIASAAFPVREAAVPTSSQLRSMFRPFSPGRRERSPSQGYVEKYGLRLTDCWQLLMTLPCVIP
ncbi:hypothetical protein R1flu_001479 [Riccia fluitans]|uniref:Secreted protein n=1 Tax=Riccia fluitans TaxID=41844 RepID=A0ABD1Y7D8_9MARC